MTNKTTPASTPKAIRVLPVELRRVIRAWPCLSEAARQSILSTVAREGRELSAYFAADFQAAFDQLDRHTGGRNAVSLVALRRALPSYDRAAFDAGLTELRRSGRFTLSAAEGRQGISAEQRAAGIEEAGALLLWVSKRQ